MRRGRALVLRGTVENRKRVTTCYDDRFVPQQWTIDACVSLDVSKQPYVPFGAGGVSKAGLDARMVGKIGTARSRGLQCRPA
jgi:hypothetical protein